MKKSQGNKSQLGYRADIDGLRAVAVLSVMAFHIDENMLSGGFLGVDIFFVISGYLITALLLKEIESTGTISIGNFYRRRIQRILPALLFLLSGVLLFGFLVMLPADFVKLTNSALASAISLANFHFYAYLPTDYFAAEAQVSPLLHMWSLGVEEQFYLLWPFMLFALVASVTSRLIRIVLILGCLIVSLVYSEWVLLIDRPFAYYMIPTRAWELLAGGLVAFMTVSGVMLDGKFREVVAGVGLMTIFMSLALVTEHDSIPGLHVIPVVVGTCLLVLSSPDTIAGRALSLPPIVAIGLVSYSAYLWHWPILVFLRYGYIQVSWSVAVSLVIATLVFATISYHLIEQPLRSAQLQLGKVFAAYLALPVVVLLMVNLVVVQGVSTRNEMLYSWGEYSAAVTEVKAAFQYRFNCQYDNFDEDGFTEERCVYPQGRKPDILLLGDSNAAHYIGMLRQFADRHDFAFRNASHSACPMVMDADLVWHSNPEMVSGCRKYRNVADREVDNYRTLIIGGSWDNYDRSGGSEFRSAIRRTIANLSTRVESIVVLAKVPTFNRYDHECEARKVRIPLIDCKERSTIADRDHKINSYIRDVTEEYDNVHYFDVRHVLCDEGICRQYLDDLPVYYDSAHLSMQGSIAIGNRMLQEKDPAIAALYEQLTGEHSAEVSKVVIGRSSITP